MLAGFCDWLNQIWPLSFQIWFVAITKYKKSKYNVETKSKYRRNDFYMEHIQFLILFSHCHLYKFIYDKIINSNINHISGERSVPNLSPLHSLLSWKFHWNSSSRRGLSLLILAIFVEFYQFFGFFWHFPVRSYQHFFTFYML